MKYVSIDCETTGTEHEKDQILSIGLAIEDTNNIKPIEELPTLHLVIARDRLEGNVFALDMNREIVKLLRDYQVSDEEGRKKLEETKNVKFVKEYDVVKEVFRFLAFHDMVDEKLLKSNFEGHSEMYRGKMIPHLNMLKPIKTTLVVAGKNFGTFDKLFIEKLTNWTGVFKFHQRILDPAILYVDWKEDELLPNLNTCMKRGGIEGEVTHDAVADALDVIKVLRAKYENKPIIYHAGIDPIVD